MNGVVKQSSSVASAGSKISTTKLRYAQCWEDCDLLLEHLAVKPGESCLSICSAGDNSLSLLTQNPGKVVAIDQCLAQLACTALKVEAFRHLEYEQMLGFLGAMPMSACQRRAIYLMLRPSLAPGYRQHLDRHGLDIEGGIINSGKLEKYFFLFRCLLLPLLHSRETIEQIFVPKGKLERERFFHQSWNTFSYRLLLSAFFSKTMFYFFGREKSFFRYQDGGMSKFIAKSAQASILAEDSYKNPYLSYILRGHYGRQLPHYLRPQSFQAIRENLHKLELVEGNLKDYLDKSEERFDCLNLSDIFEYLSEGESQDMARLLVGRSKSGARQVYWNMLVKRKLSQYVPSLQCSYELKSDLAEIAQSFFYSGFFVETQTCTNF